MKKNKKSNCLKQKGYANLTKTLFWVVLFTILSFQMALAGRPGEYAVIREDSAIKTLFKQNQLPSEYNYYYTGRSGLPYAVIGIDTKYSLNSKFWSKIESKSQIVYKIDHLMSTGATHVTYGRIIDSVGTQVGLWFSEYRNTIVRFELGNELKVFSPYRPNNFL